MSGQAEADYGPRRAAYGLKKLRGKEWFAGSGPQAVMSRNRTVCGQ
jgi:hypothetical protein